MLPFLSPYFAHHVYKLAVFENVSHVFLCVFGTVGIFRVQQTCTFYSDTFFLVVYAI